MGDLYDALTDIRGIGEAKADEIMTVLNDHTDGDTTDSRLMEKAREAAREGNDRQAALYLRRANE